MFQKVEKETKENPEESRDGVESERKKKYIKDKNAGLTIPSQSVKIKTSNKKNKLKHLLATDNCSKKNSLQDFLKKL